MMAGIAETYRNMGRFDESLAMYQEAQPLVEGLQIPYLHGGVHRRPRADAARAWARAKRRCSCCEASRRSRGDRAGAHGAARARGGADRAGARRCAGGASSRSTLARPHLETPDNRQRMAVAAFLRARALFDAHQPREARWRRSSEADSVCDDARLPRVSCGRSPPDATRAGRVRARPARRATACWPT